MCTFSWKTERPKGGMLPVGCHSALWYLPCRENQLGYSLQPQVPQYSAHASSCHCCAVWMPRDNWVSSSGNVSGQWFKLGLSLEEAVKEIVHFGNMQDMYLGSATYWLSFSFFFCKMGWWNHYCWVAARIIHCLHRAKQREGLEIAHKTVAGSSVLLQSQCWHSMGNSDTQCSWSCGSHLYSMMDAVSRRKVFATRGLIRTRDLLKTHHQLIGSYPASVHEVRAHAHKSPTDVQSLLKSIRESKICPLTSTVLECMLWLFPWTFYFRLPRTFYSKDQT